MNMSTQGVYRLVNSWLHANNASLGIFSCSFKKNNVPGVNEKAQMSICQI